MKIIEQLNKLPINKGEYLVLPNIDTPFFIIPMTSKVAFQKAISFIKPKNKYGWLKKFVLGYLPFVLIRFFISKFSSYAVLCPYGGGLTFVGISTMIVF